ncbi:MAG: alpha-2-macroglobulin family protein [Alphaproteobacteria bacterium]|nr:alpha-2-macroglobulin family protein [Alphaproteobacteria bacterium]
MDFQQLLQKAGAYVTARRNLVLAVATALVVGLWAGAVAGGVAVGGRGSAPLLAATGESGAAEPIRSANAPRQAPRGVEGMAFIQARIDVSGPDPRACLEFSRPLATDPSVNFRDFLEIDPAAQVSVEVSDTLLCLRGLSYEPDHQVTIKRGLPSQDGERTRSDETFTLSFGDRPAYVGFVGSGVILPRAEADGVAIETVNVRKIEVRVLRVNNRILSQRRVEPGEATPEGQWGYWGFEDAGDQDGVEIYKGEIDVAAQDARNQSVTTVFPLGSVLTDQRPGAYVVKLRDVTPGAGDNGENTDRPAVAYRWVMYTDMALQTFTGATGADVFVRSLRTARPMQGVTLTLIAQNNEELARAVTDNDGHVRFAETLMNGEGSARARYVMAYGAGNDFAALDLERPTLDLSDRDVSGRQPPGDIDAYMYTERGVYRPGEVVRIIGLVRDINGRAIDDRQSTLVVYRPNGTEARRQRLANAEEAGAIAQNLTLDRSSPRGQWRAELLVDGQEAAAGSVSFAVEDFVPQRLRVRFDANDAPLLAGQNRALDVQADFLYGAPGAGLPVDAEARLQIDPNPFPAFEGYAFGRADESFSEQFLQLPSTTTDGQGHAQLSFALSSPPETSFPLRARLIASVSDPGGRAVRESFNVPVRLSNRYLGVRERFDTGVVPDGRAAAFDVVAVNPAGAQVAARGVSWTLVREDWSYDWYLESGQWRWRRTGRDIPIDTGRIDLAANAPAQLTREGLEPGSYRLILRQAGSAETAHRFYVGWRWSTDSEDATPDMVTVAGPTEPTRPGGRARIEIRPPYAGEAQIVVATDRVLSVRTMRVAQGGGTITLPVEPEWGAGAYVLVTVMTPRDPANLPVPRRAVGVTYVPVDVSSRTLNVAVGEDLGVVRPRQRVNFPIQVTNAPRGEPVFVAIAAVDEGILQLTKFESPNPLDYFFGRRALGVGIRDDYGRLLNPNLGAPATPRQGGDSIGGEGLTVVPTRTVALVSPVIRLDRSGRTQIPLDVPDFNGELRLMAVAWSRSAVGQDAEAITVRDPVVAELTLPRFIAPGDAAFATLQIDNVEGPAGAYSVSYAGSGAIALDAPQSRFTLGQRQQQRVRIPFTSSAAGLGRITMVLQGPNGFQSITRTYDMQSRAPFMPVTETRTEPQAAGASWRAPNDLLAQFYAGQGQAVVSYSNLPGLDAAAYLDQLTRYPYGCSEQLVSVSMPLLYFNAVAQRIDRQQDRRIRQRVQDAVTKLLDRQAPDGSFGLWSAGDGSASPWIGAYMVDFLHRAKEQGYIVPQAALDKAYDGLRAVARLNDFASINYNFEVYQWPGSNDSTRLLRSRSAAYALYVLAKADRVNPGQLRYFHDALLDDEPSPLARAQIGAALVRLGDQARARNAFREAERALGYRNTGDWYQSPVRDLAGVLALAAEAGQTDLVARLRQRLERETPDPDSTMTQEQAQLLLAIDALQRASGPVHVSLNGQADAGRRVLIDAANVARAFVFQNNSQGQLFRTVTLSGPPREPPGAASNGFSIDKRFYALNGGGVDLSALRQGDRIIVVVSGRAEGVRTHQSVVVDLLPAGLEIESVLTPEDGLGPENYDGTRRNGQFPFVGEISYASVAEARDDRFVGAIELRNAGGYRFAYMARAVTPGTYAMPGALVEDMYRPGVNARTSVSSVRVAPRSE